jgi:hypothetical protein
MAARGVFDDSIFPGSAFLAETQISSTGTATTLTAAQACGGCETYVIATTAATLATPSAAAIYAQLVQLLQVSQAQGGPGVATPQNNIVGASYRIRVISTSGLTVSGGTGVTLVGTGVIAAASWRDFTVQITSPTTITLTSVGSGAA